MERQGGYCAHRFPYNQHHLPLDMTRTGWELFEKRVCRFSLPLDLALYTRFFQLTADAPKLPKIFLNRIKIAIRAHAYFETICDMSSSLWAIYASHAMSYDLPLPGAGKPHELVTIFRGTDTSGTNPPCGKHLHACDGDPHPGQREWYAPSLGRGPGGKRAV